MTDSDDNVPTLDEIIFPGKPEKILENEQAIHEPETETETAATSKTETPPQSVQEQLARQPTPDHEQTSRPQPKKTNFEALINRQIDAVLQKHMQAARKEIVQIVMLELRSRLPNSGNRGKG